MIHHIVQIALRQRFLMMMLVVLLIVAGSYSFVRLPVDAYPDLALSGKVRSLQAATGSRFSMLPPDNASGNFTKVVQRIPVRIDLDIPDSLRSRLVPGLSANIAIRVRN